MNKTRKLENINIKYTNDLLDPLAGSKNIFSNKIFKCVHAVKRFLSFMLEVPQRRKF